MNKEKKGNLKQGNNWNTEGISEGNRMKTKVKFAVYKTQGSKIIINT
jgi:hypothetical protein